MCVYVERLEKKIVIASLLTCKYVVYNKIRHDSV